MAIKNIGSRDAAIRGVIGITLLMLSASLQASPLLAVAAGFLAVAVLGTALYRVCPLYTVFGINKGRGDLPAR